MDLAHLKTVLLYCTIIHYAVLTLWFFVFIYAHDRLHALHGRWFKLSVDTFDTLHYGAISLYKILVLIFLAVPTVVLYLLV
jgi:hypothetical protein